MTRKKNTLSLPERTANAIKDLIKENDMQAGDKLPNEYTLAEQLNVGRSTVREAIKSLASTNILVIRQGAGTFVSEKQGVAEDPLGLEFITNEDDDIALDLLSVRLILEPEIAALAAANATKNECDNILTQCKKVEQLIEQGKDYSQMDLLFHKAIAEASGNKIIGNIIPVIHSSIVKTIDVTHDKFKENTVVYHRQITEAILRRDVQGAKFAMVMHLNMNRQALVELIEKQKML